MKLSKKALCILFALMMALSVACASPSPTPPTEPQPAPSAPVAPAEPEKPAVETPVSMKPGVYTAKVQGFKGYTTVQVTVTEAEIKKIEVTETKDTAQIFDSAYPLLPSRIIDAQSLAVDAITGATISSNAILFAARDCLTQAGAPADSFKTAPEKSTETKTIDADVVVIGAGGAGLTAAAKAAESGAKVVLVEKAAKIGGTASNTTGAMGVNPKHLTDTGVSISQEEVDTMFNQWLVESNYKLNGVILRKFLNESGKTLDWMGEHGFLWDMTNKFVTSPYLVNNNYVNHGLFGPPDDRIKYYNAFADYGKSQGVQILLETEATELLLNGDAAAGVKAERYDGLSYTINACSVILATGGYAGNSEMMKEYFGYVYRLYGMAQNKGTGIQMGLSAGAALRNPAMLCSHFTGPYFTLPDDALNNTLYSITNGSYGLLNVNMLGERFQNEAASTEQWVEGDYFWTLLSQSQVELLKTTGLAALGQQAPIRNLPFLGQAAALDAPLANIDEVLDTCIKSGLIVKANSMEALAQVTGMDAATLLSHVALYNEHCAAGKDATFGKAPELLNAYPDGESAYYAVKAAPYMYSTCGGLLVNENLQVLREDNSIIPGLYATGMDSMGVLFGGNMYLSYGGPALGWAFTSGRLAGEHAAKASK